MAYETTDDQWATARSWLPWLDEDDDRDDFDEDFDRLGGVLFGTIAERLRSIYNALLNRPDSFRLPGEYGEDRQHQMEHLRATLAFAETKALIEAGDGWNTGKMRRRGRPASRRP